MTTPDYTAIARQIYRDLSGRGVLGMVDFEVCERYNLTAAALNHIVAISDGHLRLRPPGILEAIKPETAK